MHRIDTALTTTEALAQRVGPWVLRAALATVMLWFGLPKLVPGGSPAEALVVDTVHVLTHGLVTGDAARIAVGTLEVGIGVALLVGRAMPLVLLVVLGHMAGTFTPLVLFPELTWRSPGVGTLEGQYILKNLVVIAGVVVLAGTGLRRAGGPGSAAEARHRGTAPDQVAAAVPAPERTGVVVRG